MSPPVSQASCLVILNLLHVLTHPCRRLLIESTQKNTRVTKTHCSQYCKKTKQTCRNVCTWSSGEYNWWPVSRHEPFGYYKGSTGDIKPGTPNILNSESATIFSVPLTCCTRNLKGKMWTTHPPTYLSR